MKKFYLKNGEEVKIGDVIRKTGKVNHPIFGTEVAIENILLTRKVLAELIDKGVITIKYIDDTSKTEAKEEAKSPIITKEVPMNLEFYVQKIADRLGWKVNKTYNYLNSINSIFPAAALSIILREIAIELDKKYKDHIDKSPEIYVISLLNGKITKANKAHIKNYRNFAAFRSVSDAKIACSITRDILKDIFKNGE